MISGHDIREKYLAYMKRNGHIIIPSSPLVPENDPTTLFTSSGMQPLVPYLMGQEHPMGSRLVNSQKCFRAEDIEEVGDNRHTTFFEMLGNWSLGDYFKREQIPWIYNFLIEEVGIDPQKVYVTVFAGDETFGIPKDTDSAEIWQGIFSQKGVSNTIAHMGSEAEGGERGMKDGERIFYYDAAKNWWSRSGRPQKMPVSEIGGPDTEMFYDFGTPHNEKFGTYCHPNCDCGRFMEIGNSVFIEYVKDSDSSFKKLPKQNVDFGGGLERITAAANNTPDVFVIDLLSTLCDSITRAAHTTYADNIHAVRVIADHIRGSVFMIADGVSPSNTEQGYFVRRLLRRAIRYADAIHLPPHSLSALVQHVSEGYASQYPNIINQEEKIRACIDEEETQFRKTLSQGMRILEKVISMNTHTKQIPGDDVFQLFTTYGFPVELTEELAHEQDFTIDKVVFEQKMSDHRELSRSGAEHKFKGGLSDHSDTVVMYHTATHLLLAGLRKELGNDVHQAGSNITEERLRFDFTYPQKVSPETLARVEAYVNNAIQKNAEVSIETIDRETARNDSSIEGSFWDKYPDRVNVYTIRDEEGTVYSRELCGGPHVASTQSIMGTFKITKEESSANGVRRIKAVLK